MFSRPCIWEIGVVLNKVGAWGLDFTLFVSVLYVVSVGWSCSNLTLRATSELLEAVMSSMQKRIQALKRFNDQVADLEQESRSETLEAFPSRKAKLESRVLDASGYVKAAIAEESIVMGRQRPVFVIKTNGVELKFRDREDCPIWRQRLGRRHWAVLRSRL